MAHKFDPGKLERLIGEERRRELNPEGLLREAGLKEGDMAADIGCGPGFFTVPAANIVGPAGLVFAIDTEREMLIHLRDRMNPPDNVVLLLSEENSIPLGDSEVGFALLAYMLHETADRGAFLEEVRRILSPGGRLLVIDWKKKREEKGPPEEERLSEMEALGALERAGFKGLESTEINASHYRITCRK